MTALSQTIPITIPQEAPPALRPADRPLRFAVQHSLCLSAEDHAAWATLAAETGAALTQTPSWCQAWHDHYGAGNEIRLYTGYDGDQLVAAVPVTVSRVQYGPLTLRVARLIGTEGPSACFAPAVVPTWRSAMFTAVLDALGRTDRCEAVHFGPIPEGPQLDDLRRAGAAVKDSLDCIDDRSAGVLATLELPEDGTRWTDSLSRNQRSALRKAERRLAALGAVTVDLAATGPELAGGLDRLARQHREQWMPRNRLGHFGDWPGMLAFHGDLLQRLSAPDEARIETLRVSGEPVAHQYALTNGAHAACRIASRTNDERYANGSTGQISLTRLITTLQNEGVRHVDLGTGRYDYKRRLGATETPLRQLLFASQRPSVRSRAQLIARLAHAMDFMYYRLWYCRFAPTFASRTRLPRRGLHPWWMRSRL